MKNGDGVVTPSGTGKRSASVDVPERAQQMKTQVSYIGRVSVSVCICVLVCVSSFFFLSDYGSTLLVDRSNSNLVER